MGLMGLSKGELTLLLSAIIAAGIFLVGLLIFGFELLYIIYLIVISIFVVLMPYLTIQYIKTQKLHKMEQQFPALLRDLSEAKRAGMTFSSAIEQSAKSDYGPLTGEVKEMHRKLTWGIPLPEVLESFRGEVENSKLMRRGIGIILESYYSGGAIASTMDAIADSTTTLQDVRNERKNMLRQQLLIIYVIHFVFIGTIVAMFKIMIPLLTVSPGGGAGGGGGQGQLGGVSGMLGGAPSMDYFRRLFLVTLVVQAVGNGIVAGEARSGSIMQGIKHSAIMVVGSLIGYSLFILPKTKQLEVSLNPSEPGTGELMAVKVTYRVDRETASGAEVKITFNKGTKTGITDESGQMQKKFLAPDKEGKYQLEVEATYQEATATHTQEVLVG